MTVPPIDMPDQPALGPNGQLLDTSKIEWFNDPDDPQPIRRVRPSSELGLTSQVENA
jgi:hypothetical protein